MPDREFATKEFPHSFLPLYSQIHLTGVAVVLVNSRAQQTSLAKQTTSIIKIKVNQSGEAQFFEIDIRGTFQ